MKEMIEDLAAYYAAMGFPMYSKEKLEEMSEEEIISLYEITFPNREMSDL